MKNIVAQYQGSLLAFFNKRSQSYWDAEELAQEVFCKILKRNDINGQENKEAYLFTVAWSVLLDKVRRDQVRHRNSHVYLDEVFESEDPVSLEQSVDGQILYERFVAGLKGLGEQTQEIFLLSRYEGYTYTQIAEHYGISVSAVEKHMMKALAHLKNMMRDR